MKIEIHETANTVPLRDILIGDCFILGQPEREEIYPLFMRCHPPRIANAHGHWAIRLADGMVAQYGDGTAVVPTDVKVVMA